MIRLEAGALRERMLAQFARADLAEESAALTVESMIETSLRGVDSHGIQLFPHYVRAVLGGRVNRKPAIRVQRVAPAASVVHADHAFGHHAGTIGMRAAAEAAAISGVGVASVADSTHFGAAAFFALPPAREGYIGLAFTNADALVKPPGGLIATFGTNPICFCAPMADEEPLCLDMATSATSWNRVRNHARAGTPLPPNVAHDAFGRPTQDPSEARMLEPSGGYKGYGLGVMVEVLCGLLAGGPVGRDILPMFTAPIDARRSISHFFVALSVDRFQPQADFRQRLQTMANGLRELSDGKGHVMLPGDPEKAAYELRAREGIPIEPAIWESFTDIDEGFESCRIQ